MQYFSKYRTQYCVSIIYIGFLSLFWIQPDFVQRSENTLIDYYFQLTHIEKPKQNPVVIVAIDANSIAKEGKWPWPRTTMADLIQKITQQKARTIATDISFAEAETNVLEEAIRWFEKKQIKTPLQLKKWEQYASGDVRLAEAIKTTPTVMGYYAYLDQKERPYSANQQEVMAEITQNAYQSMVSGEQNNIQVKKAYKISSNMMIGEALYRGYTNFMPDVDQRIREVPLLIQYQGQYFPPLSLVALKHWKGNAELHTHITPYKIRIHLADEEIKTTSEGMLRIRFYTNNKTFKYISASDVLSGHTTKKYFEDKLVLIGITASGIQPTHHTPYNSKMPTIEIHAQIITNLLNNQILKHARNQIIFEISILTIVAFLYALFSLLLVNKYFGSLSTLLFSIIIITGYLAFKQNIIIHTVLPALELISCFIVLTVVNYTTELRERLRLRNTFESFIDPAIVTDVIDHQQLAGLGGDERIMSVMFVDVAGFTAISERLSPQDTVKYINQFFQEATPIVFKHKGTIDRLTGDGLIVLFGAPIHDEEHAERACKTALDLQYALNKVKHSFNEIGASLSIRVGINSGKMVVGNVGSKRRLHYTFMGDAGNTAARLESLNKQYDSQRMIGETTWQEIGHEFTCREIDTVILVGKTEAIKVYELLGERKDLEKWEPMIESYASGLKLYRLGYFKEAASIFKSGAERFEDAVSKRMAQRCDELSIHPSLQWDGVWTTDRK